MGKKGKKKGLGKRESSAGRFIPPSEEEKEPLHIFIEDFERVNEVD